MTTAAAMSLAGLDKPVKPRSEAKAGLGAIFRLLAPRRWTAVSLVSAGFLLAAIQLAEAALFGAIIDRLTAGEAVLEAALLWGALGVFGIAMATVIALFADRLAHAVKVAGLNVAYERLITLPPRATERGGSGRMLRTLVAGADAVFGVTITLFREHVTAISAVLLVLPVAVAINLKLSLVLVALALVFGVLFSIVTRRAQTGQRAVEAQLQAVYSRVGDVVPNVAIVQAFGRLGAEAEALRGLTGGVLRAQYPVLGWWALLAILTRSAGTLALLVTVSIGAVLVSRGQASVGEVVTFVGFSQLIIGKLDQIGSGLTRIFVQAPTLGALAELMESDATNDGGLPVLQPTEGRVTFEDVTFRFSDDGAGVIDVNFEARPGQTVALVGPTGSGKSTTLALLQRFRDPQKGRVLIDGQDLSSHGLGSVRAALGVVFQDAGLLNRSVADNLLVAKPDATLAEMEDALRRAELWDAVQGKPGGLAFVVGERGENLSGGERQRLAIARALLKDAPVLLLDEATSALDPATEAKVKRALDEARRGRTTLAIAHRLSTIADADLILVLDKGRIVERGTYDELLRKGGLFARMAREAEGEEVMPQKLARRG
jgi:ATP-binding cassette subfamily B protein